jgi:hypothetical protein
MTRSHNDTNRTEPGEGRERAFRLYPYAINAVDAECRSRWGNDAPLQRTRPAR